MGHYKTSKLGRSAIIAFSSIVLSLSSIGMPLLQGIAHAGGYSINIGASATATAGVSTPITDVSIGGSGTTTVNVTLPNATITLPANASGVTYYEGTSTGSNITLTGDTSDINAALAAMTVEASTVSGYTLLVSLLPSANAFDAVSEHMYSYDATHRTWSAANAASEVLDGVTGHLATPLTQSQDNVLLDLYNHNSSGYLGGNDVTNKGTWRWMTGPENGTVIGSNGAVTDWASGYPTDPMGYNSTCTEFDPGDGAVSGNWVTSPCSPTVAYRVGSFIEYDMSSNITQESKTITVAAPSSGGGSSNSGGSSTPAPVAIHDISDCGALQHMADDPTTISDTFKLTADIDCHNVPFTPLVWGNAYFLGTFNGQGHTISGLNISATNKAGLFYEIDGGTIENLTFGAGTGVTSTSDEAGALAGLVYDTQITNVNSQLSVSGGSQAGGLVGDYETYAANMTMSGCSSTGAVSGDGYTGGLIGYAGAGDYTLTIKQSFSSGTVSNSSDYTGGLIGEAEAWADDTTLGHLIIHDVYSHSNITAPASNQVGGLIGAMNTYTDSGNGPADIVISNAYSSGSIDAYDAVGSLIGTTGWEENDGPVTLQNVFAASPVTLENGDPSYYGYVIGDNYDQDEGGGPATGSGIFYDGARTTLANLGEVQCSGDSDFAGGSCTDVNDDGTHPAYFLNNHVNAPMDTWDFSGIWITNVGDYPTFRPYVSDNDGDGVPGTVENAGPNNGDANDDGTLDSQQDNVVSFVNPLSGKYEALAVNETCAITSASGLDVNQNATKDSAYTYPLGMMNFSISCGTPGYVATVNEYFYGSSSSTYTLRKYTPNNHAYTTVPGATLAAMTIGGQTVTKATYQVTDGGSLDSDGTANGVIVDPAGLGVQTVSIPNTGLGGGQ